MEIYELLKRAWEETEKSGVPQHLHELAFTHALAMLGKPPQARVSGGTSVAGVNGQLSGSDAVEPGNQAGSEQFFDAFARETGIPRDQLEEVFYFHDGKPGINIPARKLGGNKAEQTRSVALLLFAAHHYALDENEVPVEVVRDACVALKCHDTANFSSNLGKLDSVNYTGPKNKKVLRAKGDTAQKFEQKILSLLRSNGE